MKRWGSSLRLRGAGLAGLLVLAAASLAGCGGKPAGTSSGAPVPVPFPAASPEEFTALLDWATTANSDDVERLVDATGWSARGTTEAEQKAQKDLLLAVALEGDGQSMRGNTRYRNYALFRSRPPAYASTALLRAAQLDSRVAWWKRFGWLILLGQAQRLNPNGSLWIREGNTWQIAPVRETTQKEFLRIHGERLTYQTMRQLHAALPGSESHRFLLSVLVVVLAIRLLEAPLMVATFRAARRGSDDAWKPGLAWAVLEGIVLLWSYLTSPMWMFVMPVDSAGFLWVHSLCPRNLPLAFLDMTAFCIYSFVASRMASSRGEVHPFWPTVAFTYALSAFCLSLRDGVGGFQNVYFLALWLSGLGMAITCYALAGIGRKRRAR